MGLGDKLKRVIARRVLGDEVLGKVQSAIDWFTAVPGRKRTIAAVCACIGIGLDAVDGIFKRLCESEVLHGSLCTVDPSAWVAYVQAVNDFVQATIVPGADALALIFGIWGVANARTRNTKQTAVAQAVADRTEAPVTTTLAHVITDAKGDTIAISPVTPEKTVEPTSDAK